MNYQSTTKGDKIFKSELFLDVDMFNKPVVMTDLEALAQVIQRLVLIEKGTYPNHPDIGVGISNYLFEIADTSTLNDIEYEINNQIEKFIDVSEINIDVKCSMEKSTNRVNNKTDNILVIQFFITRLNSINTDTESFYIYASTNKTNKKTITEIVI